MSYPDYPVPSQLHKYIPPPEFMDNSLYDYEQLPDNGTEFILKLQNAEDLERVVLQSDTSYFTISKIQLEEADGVAFFGTLRDKFVSVVHKLESSKSFFSCNSENYRKLQIIIDTLNLIIDGSFDANDERVSDFVIILSDPLSSSFISSPPSFSDHQVDKNLVMQRVPRTWKQEEELNLLDQYYPEQQFLTATEEQFELDHHTESSEEDKSNQRQSDEELTQTAIDEFVKLIRQSCKICILSGAGVSTESNIPAYRSISAVNENRDNIWDNFDANDENINNFMQSEDCRKRYWKRNLIFRSIIENAKPNASHDFAVDIFNRGKLLKVITQNIDGLYLQSGLPRDKLIEIHGTARSISCLSCSKSYDLDETYRQFQVDDIPPRCQSCNGLLKPDTISFGQPIPSQSLKECENMMNECDLLIVMGSSLIVKPVNDFPGYALVRKVPLVIMNYGDTKFDSFATVLFDRQKCGELSQIVTAKLS